VIELLKGFGIGSRAVTHKFWVGLLGDMTSSPFRELDNIWLENALRKTGGWGQKLVWMEGKTRRMATTNEQTCNTPLNIC
jgi:hypothetical protein